MSVESLAQALLEAGILDTSSVALRLPRARTGKQLLDGLIGDGLVTEPSLVAQLARSLSVPRYDPKERLPESDAVALLDQKSAEELGVLPVAVRGGGALLWVALCDPTDEPLLSEVSRRTGRRVKACLIGPRELTKALQQLQLGEAMTPQAQQPPPPPAPTTIPGLPVNTAPNAAQRQPTAPPPTPSFGAVPNGYAPSLSIPGFPAYPFASGVTGPQPFGSMPPAMPNPSQAPPGRTSDLQRLEEELAQVRHVVKVLTQMLVERGALDGDDLKRRLRADRERKS